MWPQLPIEFFVVGTAVSFQNASTASRTEWKDRVRNAGLAAIPAGSWALVDIRLSVSIVHFPADPAPGDLDNRIKLILDALAPTILLDDDLIDRVITQRIPPDTDVTFKEPSDILLAAMASPDPTVYIKIAEVSLEDIPL